jgi:hypothetical protein
MKHQDPLTTASPHPTSPHPSPALLLAYHADELSETEADSVREHVVECDECLEAVLDMASCEEELASGGEVEGAPEEKWAEFQAMLGAAPDAPSPVMVPPPEPATAEPPTIPRVRPPAGSTPWPHQWALAAMMLLSLGLTAFFAHQRGRLQESRTPRANPLIVSLVSEQDPEFRDASSEAVPASSSLSDLTVVLTPPDAPAFPEYRVLVFSAGSHEPLHAVDGLEPQEGGVIQVFLPALPVAGYRLDLFGLEEGKEELLGTYRLRLEARD